MFGMSVPEWLRSDVEKETRKAIERARGSESQIVQRMESMGLQQDVSEEKVTRVLDNISQKHIEDFSSALADEIYDGPRASTSGGQKVMADGGDEFDGFFEGRSGRVYYVMLSIFNTAMSTVHLQSGREFAALFSAAILIGCLGLYIADEYNVGLEVQ